MLLYDAQIFCRSKIKNSEFSHKNDKMMFLITEEMMFNHFGGV